MELLDKFLVINRSMKNCSKCKSENIKKIGPFARKIRDGQYREQGNQMVNYQCRNCGNEWKEKFSEDNLES